MQVDDIKVILNFGDNDYKLYDKESLISVKTMNSNGFNAGRPTWDVVSNYATIRLRDLNGELGEMANQRTLNSIRSIKIMFGGKPIGLFASNNISYNMSDKMVTINCLDSLSGWQDILFRGMGNDRLNNAWHFFDMLARTTRNLTDEDVVIGKEDEDFLRSIKLPHGFIRPQSLRNAWQQLCRIALAVVYNNIDGEIHFVCGESRARGLHDENNQEVKNIYKSEILKPVNADLVVTNQIQGVFGEELRVTNEDYIEEQTKTGAESYIHRFIRQSLTGSASQGEARAMEEYEFNISIAEEDRMIEFTNPVRDPTVKVWLVCNRFTWSRTLSQSRSAAETSVVRDWISRMSDFEVSSNVKENLNRPNVNFAEDSRLRIELGDIGFILEPCGRKIKIDTTFNHTLQCSIFANLRPIHIMINHGEGYAEFLEPQSIEIVASGQSFQTRAVPFRFGSDMHSKELARNTFLHTTAEVNQEDGNKSLPEFIHRTLRSKWGNGKQVIRIEIIAPTRRGLYRVGDIVLVDGINLKFRIVLSEFVYDGTRKQVIDMQEI